MLLCSCRILLGVQMYVCIVLHVRCVGLDIQHDTHYQNGDNVQLSLTSDHCQTGWFRIDSSPTSGKSKYNRTTNTFVVCKKCSECSGVIVLSPCTGTQDVECSKICQNPNLIYHESTKSCRDYVLGDTYEYGLPQVGFMQERSFDYDYAEWTLQNAFGSGVEPKETVKDPNILFVASAVIFCVLMLLTAPQALSRMYTWIKRNELCHRRETGM